MKIIVFKLHRFSPTSFSGLIQIGGPFILGRKIDINLGENEGEKFRIGESEREEEGEKEREREMEREKKRWIFCKLEISRDEQAYHCNFE